MHAHKKKIEAIGFEPTIDSIKNCCLNQLGDASNKNYRKRAEENKKQRKDEQRIYLKRA